MAPSVSAHISQTLEFFASLGVAVFHQRCGLKGSFETGWPDLPVAAANALTREEASLGPINLAGRTGNGVAVLDYDGKEVDSRTAVEDLLTRLGDALIGVVETGNLRPETGRVGRGRHVWVAVTEEVGNGYCTAIGGEVFSGPHLAMLPPSRHPDGSTYRWLHGPRVPKGAVDLRALNLVPDKPAREPTGRSGTRNRKEAAPGQRQAEFERLFAKASVNRGRNDSEKVNCVWHDDRHASLNIDWVAAIFHCFGCETGGGVVRLRELVDEPPRTNTPTYLQRRERGSDPVDNWGYSSPQVSTAKLAEALARLDQPHPEKTRARDVGDCGTRFRPGKCSSCAGEPAFPITCGLQICPACGPRRLTVDWRRNERSLPAEMRILVLRSPDALSGSGSLKKLRARFRQWRERNGLTAGLHGARFERPEGVLSPEILLAIPSAEPVPESSRAFIVEELAEQQSPEDVLRWLQREYLTESPIWESDEELAFLLEEVVGRRKFQGFGLAYAAGQHDEAESKAHPKGTARVSGGSAKGGKKEATCPECGGHVDLYPFTVAAEQVQRLEHHFLWTGPVSAARAVA